MGISQSDGSSKGFTVKTYGCLEAWSAFEIPHPKYGPIPGKHFLRSDLGPFSRKAGRALTILAAAVVIGGPLLGCEGPASDTPTPGITPVLACQGNQRTTPVHFDVACTEIAAIYPVSATLARQLVPSQYDLDLLTDGSAQMWVVQQDCSKFLSSSDGDLGPLPFVHVWIKILGDATVVPVPGATQTLPGVDFYSLAEHTTNRDLCRSSQIRDGACKLVDSASMTPYSALRTGEVVQNRKHGYRWQENQTALYPEVLLGANLRYYHGRSRGTAQCLLHNTSQGQVALQADPGSVMSSLGLSFLGASDDWTIECQATFELLGKDGED